MFDFALVLALAAPFGIAMATFHVPPLLSFALGLSFGFLAYRVADDWWEAHH